jgi:hypothetical protein
LVDVASLTGFRHRLRWQTVAAITEWNLNSRPITPEEFARRVENAVADR